MNEEARAVLEAARKLPPDQQILVAETLLESADIDAMTDEELSAELERRADEAMRGVMGIPWETVRDMR